MGPWKLCDVGTGLRKLVFIVNGEDVPVPAVPDDSLRTLMDEALEVSRNIGRPFEEWELRDTNGAFVKPETLVSQLAKDARLLFLTLRVGAGGEWAAA